MREAPAASRTHIPDSLIYRDQLVYVAHVLPQQGTAGAYLGYVIVETQRYTPDLANLTKAEAVGIWVARIARALTMVVHAEHVYAFVLGHHVAHFHEHVVAPHPGAPREYWGGSASTSGQPRPVATEQTTGPKEPLLGARILTAFSVSLIK